MDNPKLYTRLLAKFRDTQKDFAANFRLAQAGPDPTAAAREAHTLRGTAGTLGAKRVAAAAGDLERACRANESSDRIDALLAVLVAELEPVIEGLGAVRETRERVKDAPFDPARVRLAVTRLARLLADNDSEAADAIDDLEQAVSGTPLEANVSRAASAVARYDFEEALEHLVAMKGAF